MRARADVCNLWYKPRASRPLFGFKFLIETLSKPCFPFVLKYVHGGITSDCHMLHKFLFIALFGYLLLVNVAGGMSD